MLHAPVVGAPCAGAHLGHECWGYSAQWQHITLPDILERAGRHLLDSSVGHVCTYGLTLMREAQ